MEHDRLRKRLLWVILPLVLGLALLAGVPSLPSVHAQGYPTGPGTVCLNDPSDIGSPDPCASFGTNPIPFIFNAPYPPEPETSPQQIVVGVYINGSAGLDGFTVILNASYTYLKPVSVSLTGTVLLGTPTVLAECLSGVLIQGSACNSVDSINTVDVNAISASGEPDTPSPTTGLLFTVTYNVTGNAPSAGVPIGFATSNSSCAFTSVSGNVCVTIANGGLTANSETIQSATFDNSACVSQCSWFAMTSNVTSTYSLKGGSTGNNVRINATAVNGLPTLGGGTITFTAAASSGFTAPTLSPPSCTLTNSSSTSCTTVTVSTSTAGSYTVTVFGSYVGDNCGPGNLTTAAGACTTTYSLVGVVNFRVNVGGVGWTVLNSPSSSAQTMYFAKGAFGIPYIFQSLGGYSGTITLTQSTCTPGTTGVVCPVPLPSPFTLSNGTTLTEMINFTATAYGSLSYKDSMSAAGITGSTTQGTLTIKIDGYSMVSNSTSVGFGSGGSGGVSVTLTSLGVSGSQFAGSVPIKFTVSPSSGLSVACIPLSVTLTAGGNGQTVCTFSGTVSARTVFTVTITGKGSNSTSTSSFITNSTAAITVTVDTGIDITASPATVSANSGSSGTSTITVSSRSGFIGTVGLTVSSTISCSVNPTSITLGTSGTSTLSCSATTGTYLVTVTGTSGSTTNSTIVTFNFQDYSVSASPTSVSSTTSVAGTSTITVAPLNGFSGTVTFSVTTNSTSLTCSLSPASVSGGSGSSTLSCTGSSAGNYLANVTGTSGSLLHFATVTYHVSAPPPDFSISSSSTSVSVKSGTAGTSTITVSPLNGFTGTVTLTVSTNSTSLSCTLSSTSVSGGSGTSTLSCTGSATGGFLATVKGTSGSLSHTAAVAYTIQSSGASSNILGLSPTVFYSLIGAIIAIIVLAAVLLWLRSRKIKTATPAVKPKKP
jgi:hypothetical protein